MFVGTCLAVAKRSIAAMGLLAVAVTLSPDRASAGGVSTGAAVGIGLGALALGTMAAASAPAPYYPPPAYYPPPPPAYYPAPAYYGPYGPRSCWDPYYQRYVVCY